jgi:hypothetical protein
MLGINAIVCKIGGRAMPDETCGTCALSVPRYVDDLENFDPSNKYCPTLICRATGDGVRPEYECYSGRRTTRGTLYQERTDSIEKVAIDEIAYIEHLKLDPDARIHPAHPECYRTRLKALGVEV